MAQVFRLFDSESIESMLARFRREVNRSGLHQEMVRREFFRTRTEKKKSKHMRHLKRLRKFKRWAETKAQVQEK